MDYEPPARLIASARAAHVDAGIRRICETPCVWLVVPSSAYAPESSRRGCAPQVVCDHFETFRTESARAHVRGGLPRFIEEEFRGFLLRCGFSRRWLCALPLRSLPLRAARADLV